LRHLQGLGHSCQRITTLSELASRPAITLPTTPKPTPKQVALKPFSSSYDCLLAMLTKGSNRPSTRAALVKHSINHLKNLPADKVEALVNRLFTEGKVSETGTKLMYHL
jgi:hypothetical protein